MNNHEITISIRNLVELVLRSGDLDTRFMGGSRALEGTKAHQKIQKSYKEGYTAEVTLKKSIAYKGFLLTVKGRADGIFIEDDYAVIDEIKTVTKPIEALDENNTLHWAQAKCYGYIYADEKGLEEMDIQLTYYQLDTEEIKKFSKTFHKNELETFFYDLIEKYFYWAKLTADWHNKRNESIKKMDFPFENYRRGQRKLAVAVYKTIKEEKKLFAQAPTGIGKTISTLFPAVKAMGEGLSTKIFYLTAKTITRQVAQEAFTRMEKQGLDIKTVTLTAKDKICFEKESSCNPEECSFARGHFDRINDSIRDIFENENAFTREIIEDYAKKHQVCPFEFSLDLTLWADCVICDYNYVFDPRVYLKRFFSDNHGDYTFLIDEAHNLVDRSRMMYSAELYKKKFLDLKRIMKDKEPKIAKELDKINRFMIKKKKELEGGKSHVQREEPHEIYHLLRRFMAESDKWLSENQKIEGYEELLDLYFDASAFLRIAEFYDERYVTYIEEENKDIKLKIFCLDPSCLLGEAIKRGKSAVFFSATLTPLNYFQEILGGDGEDYVIRLDSPFERENLCLLIAHNISTRYKDREDSYEDIAAYIIETITARNGKYLVFFPSYKYMDSVITIFKLKYPHINIIQQSPVMTEEEQEAFLENFEGGGKENLVGFGVLGGIFSEGIDLAGDRLLGTIIVGVGLPQISLETDIIRDYFNRKNNHGFEYAYMYPGMNKVLQAAGRVIRSEGDRGVVLLIDERFTYQSYQRIFPKDWHRHLRVNDTKDMTNSVKKFWEGFK